MDWRVQFYFENLWVRIEKYSKFTGSFRASSSTIRFICVGALCGRKIAFELLFAAFPQKLQKWLKTNDREKPAKDREKPANDREIPANDRELPPMTVKCRPLWILMKIRKKKDFCEN